jgi:CHAT domain-containing protein
LAVKDARIAFALLEHSRTLDDFSRAPAGEFRESPAFSDTTRNWLITAFAALREEADMAVRSKDDMHRLNAQERAETLLAQAAFELNPPDKQRVSFGDPLASISLVQSTLPPNALLLTYGISDERVWCFAASPSQLDVQDTSLTQTDLTALVRSFFHECRALLPSFALDELAERLLSPVGNLLDRARTLIFMPPPEMYGIPFQAMCYRGKLIAKNHVVTYLPGISYLLRDQRTNNKTITQDAACTIIGVPKVKYESFPELRGINTEIEVTKRFFSNIKCHIGDDATSEQLLNPEGQTSVLHLACHGHFDIDAPLLSRLFLADRPVYAFELYMAPLRVKLAVLSACHTAEAYVDAGGEGQGLANAFMSAGSQSVLATRWPMTDDVGSTFIQAFYEALLIKKNGLSKAVQLAQLKIRESSGWEHPFFWAPFVAFGHTLWED